jgi:MFS transporter, FHS family, Na+ dependent glucose transporter 1
MKTKQPDQQPDSFKRLYLVYFLSFVFLGSAAAALGPALLQLGRQTGTTLDRLSLIFPFRAGSYLFGSWLAGRLYDKFTGHRILRFGLIGLGVTLAVAPYLGALPVLLVVLLGMGLSMGLVDVGCNTLMLRAVRKNSAAKMNSLHFFYGVGSFFSPLILAAAIEYSGNLQWGFSSLAALSIIILLLLIGLETPANHKPAGLDLDGQSRKHSLWVVLIAVLFFFYVGTEVGFGNWVATYAVKMKYSGETQAAVLTSVFYGAYTFGRLISIPTSTVIRPQRLLLGSYLGAALSLVLIVSLSQYSLVIWIGTVLLGLCLAAIFPTMLSWAGMIMPVSAKTTSWFFVTGGLGAVTIPWVIGQFVESRPPIVIPSAILGISFSALVIFSLTLQLIRNGVEFNFDL